MIHRNANKDDAVSPVVGVMLMLVVTIIIAAVVATFASGMFAGTSATPQAVFSVDYQATTLSDGYSPSAIITFTHKGGDTIPASNFNLVLEEYGMVETYSIADGNGIITILPNGGSVSTGDQIIFDGTAANAYMYGQTEWSILDSASGNKIASGSFWIE